MKIIASIATAVAFIGSAQAGVQFHDGACPVEGTENDVLGPRIVAVHQDPSTINEASVAAEICVVVSPDLADPVGYSIGFVSDHQFGFDQGGGNWNAERVFVKAIYPPVTESGWTITVRAQDADTTLLGSIPYMQGPPACFDADGSGATGDCVITRTVESTYGGAFHSITNSGLTLKFVRGRSYRLEFKCRADDCDHPFPSAVKFGYPMLGCGALELSALSVAAGDVETVEHEYERVGNIVQYCQALSTAPFSVRATITRPIRGR